MSDKQYPEGEQNFRKNVQDDQPADSADATPAEVDATDAAQKLADDNDIDISTLTGSGAEGRVLVSDVQAAIDAKNGN